jgi:anaerobic ribonucleoside-triphosphate reductase
LVIKSLAIKVEEQYFNEITSIAKALNITKNQLVSRYVMAGIEDKSLKNSYIKYREEQLDKEKENLKALLNK